jgi:uncharacterized protein YndB with AHSA1/START domain
MRTSESVRVPSPPARVYPLIADLATYPSWLGLVHSAVAADDTDPAWRVELRAKVGPFARSKQLRMVRVEAEPDRLAVFERAEVDGREHARWALRAELAELDDGATEVTMHLAYDGALWTGGLLERVLDDEIRRGRDGLVRVVNGEPTR